MFKKGEFISWTGTDAEGTFSYVGKVQSATDKFIIIEMSNGSVCGIPTDEGTFEVARKPRNWGVEVITKPKAEREVKKVEAISKPKKVVARKSGGPSKVDLIVELLRTNKPASRKEAIEMIVAAGISTPAGASTFYNTAKNLV